MPAAATAQQSSPRGWSMAPPSYTSLSAPFPHRGMKPSTKPSTALPTKPRRSEHQAATQRLGPDDLSIDMYVEALKDNDGNTNGPSHSMAARSNGRAKGYSSPRSSSSTFQHALAERFSPRSSPTMWTTTSGTEWLWTAGSKPPSLRRFAPSKTSYFDNAALSELAPEPTMSGIAKLPQPTATVHRRPAAAVVGNTAAQPSAHPARSSTATFVTTAVVVDEWTEAPVARRTIDDGVARVQALDHQIETMTSRLSELRQARQWERQVVMRMAASMRWQLPNHIVRQLDNQPTHPVAVETSSSEWTAQLSALLATSNAASLNDNFPPPLSSISSHHSLANTSPSHFNSQSSVSQPTTSVAAAAAVGSSLRSPSSAAVGQPSPSSADKQDGASTKQADEPLNDNHANERNRRIGIRRHVSSRELQKESSPSSMHHIQPYRPDRKSSEPWAYTNPDNTNQLQQRDIGNRVGIRRHVPSNQQQKENNTSIHRIQPYRQDTDGSSNNQQLLRDTQRMGIQRNMPSHEPLPREKVDGAAAYARPTSSSKAKWRTVKHAVQGSNAFRPSAKPRHVELDGGLDGSRHEVAPAAGLGSSPSQNDVGVSTASAQIGGNAPLASGSFWDLDNARQDLMEGSMWV